MKQLKETKADELFENILLVLTMKYIELTVQ